MSIKQSVKELTWISYFLFSHNSSDSCASAPFRQIPFTSASKSWYVSHVRDLALEVVKEKIPVSSSVVYSNPSTTILRNLNLTLPTGSCCLLIGANGSGKSTLLSVLGGRHITPPDSNVRVLGINSFCDTKINFYCAYLGTDWGMRTVDFAGVGIPLMEDIPVYGMMESSIVLTPSVVMSLLRWWT